MTQQISLPFGEQTNLNFSKTLGNQNLFNTFKSQDTNYSTFKKTNKLTKDDSIYSNIKLQYTIVSNFLTKMNLNYTLKILNDEIKNILNPNTIYTLEEISQILNINNNEDDMNYNYTNNLFSETLNTTYLNYLINSKTNINKTNKGVQTILANENNNGDNLSSKNTFMDSKIDLYEDINEKLNKIDEKYNKKISDTNAFSPQKNNFVSKFDRYKKELNEKYKEDMQNEIDRIKTMEVGKVIIEQNHKYLEKIEKIRKEYEEKYEIKNNELNQKIKVLKEKENKLQTEYVEKTKELISQYQQKLENLSKKEDAFNQKCIKEFNYLKEQKNALDKKDRELFILKKDYDKESQKEVNKIKVEFKNIYKQQLQKIYDEKEKEIEELNNEIKLIKITNNLNASLKLDSNKTNEQCLKNLLDIKEKLSKLKSENKEKKAEINTSILPLADNKEEKAKLDDEYYGKLTELESQFNVIVNKFKYKHFNPDIYPTKNLENNFVVKDPNIQKKLEYIEEIENAFEKELKNEFDKFNEEIPKVDLTKKEIEQIKDDKYKIALSNIEKEKKLNEIYTQKKEEENILNKIKYLSDINSNLRKNHLEINKDDYKVINKNEMENHKNMYLKIYRERRERQKMEENRKKEELIKNLELLELAKKEKLNKGKEREKEVKFRDKKDEEKSQFSKSIALPPVKNPKEKKILESSQVDEIEELIHKSKIRIAENKEKTQFLDRIKLSNNSEEDEYGSGDFYDLSNEDKSKVKSEKTNKSNKILNSTNKENATDSYNDFETTKALNKHGILSETSEKNKSNEEFKF